jgi:hypothetical protein
MKAIIAVVLMVALSGCVQIRMESTVGDYMASAQAVKLGMDKQQVSEILEPSQQRLKNQERKQPGKYIENGAEIEIVYFRSGWQSDGIMTDDEYTPYVFNNNRLVAIGWETIGGPKSVGQVVPVTYINNNIDNKITN